ncbi:MAG TPA: hypothetical protein VFD32_17805 [Dehalococcoidia bacterium]|nr:hypothetical protein [Dehalococcoidia bacterium]
MMLEELLAQARVRELRHALARAEREANALRIINAPRRPAGPSRSERLLNDLYGPGRHPGADPALFQRLVWNGMDL